MRIENILTCDLEDWYHPSLIGIDSSQWHKCESRIAETTNRILQLFRTQKCKATFFVLGYVAERNPELIKKIHAEGHEIASHGYAHKLVYQQSPEEFRTDLRQSLEILRSITGEQVIGYRAPSWSIKKEFHWFWEILAEEGLLYDSSLFPLKTFLYGDNKTPVTMHKHTTDSGVNLMELPPSAAVCIGKRIPFSGGFFLRMLPLELAHFFIRQLNKKGIPAVVYFHPWEIDTGQPKIKLRLRDTFIQYANIHNMENKIKNLLQKFCFTSIRSHITQNKL